MLGSELASMSAIARTEDERSESEVASEIGYSQSTERAIARSVTVISLRNPANPPSDTHALWPRLGRLGTGKATGYNCAGLPAIYLSEGPIDSRESYFSN